MNFSTFDLRLLNVFDAVFSERSMSRAAKRLGLTQPAVSNAVGRLRYQLEDELFVRTADGVVPTARAKEIAPPIQDALRQIQLALTSKEFHPENIEKTFSFAISTNSAPLLLPNLYSNLKLVAPRLSLMVQDKRNSMIVAQLDSAKIDCAIGVIYNLPSRFDRQDLYADRLVCAIRHDHPLATRRMGLADYVSAPHLSVYPAGEGVAHLDKHFQEYGITRRTSVSINQLLLVPEILKNPDIVLTGFRSVIENHPAFGEFRISNFPINIAHVTISMVWHRARGKDPGQEWFRNQIIKAAASLSI